MLAGCWDKDAEDEPRLANLTAKWVAKGKEKGGTEWSTRAPWEKILDFKDWDWEDLEDLMRGLDTPWLGASEFKIQSLRAVRRARLYAPRDEANNR